MVDLVREFRVGDLYTNDQIRSTLQIENLGGIRPSVDSKNNMRHLAILTAAGDTKRSFVDNPYRDRIENDILLFTGQGREGDQQLTGRNKRLLEQYSSPIPYYGFITEHQQAYRFLGLLEIVRHYQEQQLDRKNNLRKVWLFEFRIHRDPSAVPIDQAAVISASILAESRSRTPSSDLERDVANLMDTEKPDIEFNSLEAEDLRSHLFQIAPYKFELLIKRLMEVNGFRDVSVTSISNDGGIDINAYVGYDNIFLASTYVQAQVKRWRHAVGSVEINKFRGALSTTAKGIFVTTSYYTRAAIIEAQHELKPSITLIDGGKLSFLVMRSNVNIASFL